jgi:hypothetical protein
MAVPDCGLCRSRPSHGSPALGRLSDQRVAWRLANAKPGFFALSFSASSAANAPRIPSYIMVRLSLVNASGPTTINFGGGLYDISFYTQQT